MKFTMLFGRPTNHSCYASRVLLNRRRGLALKSDVVIVQRVDAWRISWLRDCDTASCVISGTKSALPSIASDLSA
jgi:hypothetical protein